MIKLDVHNTADLPTMSYLDLCNLQGALKEMNEADEAKFLSQLQEDGFRFPFVVWVDKKGKAWTVDGNGRIKVFAKNNVTNAEGGFDFPILKVYAANKQDAAKNILRISSEYHKKTKEGLEFFLSDHGIDMEWVEERTAFTDSFYFGQEEEDVKVEDAKEDEYDIPDVLKSDIVPGDIFEFTKGKLKHRLLCGDSTLTDDWEKLMEGEMLDMVNTDPPYNVDYVGKTKDKLKIQNDNKTDSEFYQFLYDFFTAAGSYTKPGGAWYVWHADSEGANFRKAMAEGGLLLKQCLIWKKNSMVMGRQDYHWQHEPCLYGWKPGAAHSWYTDRKQTTILEFDRPSRSTHHPTMKPIPLLGYQLGNSSQEGDRVGDGFCGSGSLMVACHEMNRNGYGIEKDPKYCQVTVDRMLTLDGEIKLLMNGKDVTKKFRKALTEKEAVA